MSGNRSGVGLTYDDFLCERGDVLTTPLLPGLELPLDKIFPD